MARDLVCVECNFTETRESGETLGVWFVVYRGDKVPCYLCCPGCRYTYSERTKRDTAKGFTQKEGMEHE